MPDVRIPGGVMTVAGSYKPGDQAPDGYLAWHDWAEAQHKAGLRQKECAKCGRWKYPQELSGQTAEYTGTTRGGQEVRMVGVVCNACADLPPNAEVTGGPLAARPVDCRVRGEKSAMAARQEKGQK